jgi:cation:H+ antiporter
MTEAWFGFACGAVLLFAGTTWLARLIGGAAAGAGWLVRGPVAVAAAGATAVLATSLTASLRGSPGVALGSVIGSAVATVALGLGIAAVGRPLRGSLPLLYRQLPAMMAASGLVWFLSGDSRLSQADGAVLVGAFVVWAALSARPIRAVTRVEPVAPVLPVTRPLIVLAVFVVTVGAVLLVSNGLDLQSLLGLSEWRTGLTLIAVAAAAPTLVALVRVGWAGHGDAALATAALVNTTNVLLVLGVVCAVRPFALRDPAAFRELPALGLSAVFLVPALLHNLRVSRYEGVTWVAAYAALVAWQLGAFRTG